MPKELYEMSELDLKQNPDLQKQIFGEMLRKLENEGKCRHVFHRLAFVLFKDSLSDGVVE